eukprot:1002413_1
MEDRGDCFDPMNYYRKSFTLTANNTVLTMNKESRASAFLSREVKILSGVHRWRFKILTEPVGQIHIGIYKSKNEVAKYLLGWDLAGGDHKGKSYMYFAHGGSLSEPGPNGKSYGQPCLKGDIIDMILDLSKLELKYVVDGQDCGVANKVEKTPYKAAVSMYTDGRSLIGNSIELVSYNNSDVSAPPVSDANSVATFLGRLGLQQFTSMFKENGYETIDELIELNSNDLMEIGVKQLRSRKAILKGIATFSTEPNPKSNPMPSNEERKENDIANPSCYTKTQILVRKACIICVAIGEYMNKKDLYDVCRDVANYRNVLSNKYQYTFMCSVDMKGNPGYTMTKHDVEWFLGECVSELLGLKRGGSLMNPKIEYEALLVAFSGHGTMHSIVCSDSKEIQYSTIRGWFSKIPEMKQIPQLFCIDACRVAEKMNKDLETKHSDHDTVGLAARGDGSDAPTATIMGQTEGHIVRGGKVSKYLCKQWDEEFEAKTFNPDAIYKQFGTLYEAAFDEVMNDTKHSKTPQRLIAAEYDRRIDKLVFIPKDRDRGTKDGAQVDGTVPVIDDDLRNILGPQTDSKMDLLKHFFVLFNANYRDNALLCRLNKNRLDELGIKKVFEQKELIRRVCELNKHMARMGQQQQAKHPSQQTAILPQKYRDELSKLKAMGFTDVNANIQALVAEKGDVQGAVNVLLTNNY